MNMNNNYSLTNEYSERYEKLMASLSEAKADAGVSPEEKAKKRDERKFGKSWEAEGGKPSSTEMRRATHASKRREATGKETPEDKAKRAKAVAEREAAGQSKSGTQVQKLTGHQRGGKKRSIKAKLAKGPSKPLPLPDHHQNYFDLLNSLLEGNKANKAKRKEFETAKGRKIDSMRVDSTPKKTIEVGEIAALHSPASTRTGRTRHGVEAIARRRFRQGQREDITEAGKASAHWKSGNTPDDDEILVGTIKPGLDKKDRITKTTVIPAKDEKKFSAARKAFPTLSRGSSSYTEAGGAFAGSAGRPKRGRYRDAQREDSSNKTYNDLLNSLLNEVAIYRNTSEDPSIHPYLQPKDRKSEYGIRNTKGKMRNIDHPEVVASAKRGAEIRREQGLPPRPSLRDRARSLMNRQIRSGQAEVRSKGPETDKDDQLHSSHSKGHVKGR